MPLFPKSTRDWGLSEYCLKSLIMDVRLCGPSVFSRKLEENMITSDGNTPPNKETIASTKSEDFKIERYKFILQQINLSNEIFHKQFNLYQTLATAVISGTAALFLTWKELKISAEAAVIGVRAFEGLLVLITAFLVFTGIAGLFSWLDYRHEEVALMDKTVGVGFRKLPEWKNLWRWNETWLLAFVIIATIIAIWFAESRLITLIK
jgi:hypothetical protein